MVEYSVEMSYLRNVKTGFSKSDSMSVETTNIINADN